MKRLSLLLLLTGCVGGWNPYGPHEPREMCVTTVWTSMVEDGSGWLLRVDSISHTGDPPCIEVTEVVS